MALTVSNDTLVGALPFLQKMLASAQPAPDATPAPPPSDAPVVDMSDQPKASVLPFIQKQMQAAPMGPPAPPPETDQQPDFTVGQPPAPAPPPPDPMADLAAAPQGAAAKPQLAPETKGHKLLRILQAGIQGGIAGQEANAQTYAATGRNGGFGVGLGAGYQAPYRMPFQRALLGQEVERGGLQNEQIRQMLPFLRAGQIAGLQKTGAEARKASAEADAVPVKSQLEQAQTEASYYKDDPNLGLIDIRTKQPVAGNAGMAPLSAEEAAVLGKNPGDNVPLKLKNTANEIVNRGIKSVSANGRQLLVDNKGNTIKDMGAATPMAVINAQMQGPGTSPSGALTDKDMETVAQSVAAGKQDMATALRPYMRFPGKANALEARVLQINPDYFQGDYANRLKVLEKATQGSWADQKIAFNTALQHADLLMEAAKALKNGDSRTLSGLSNKFESEFGSPDLTNFKAIANAYNHEITSVISKGHITDSEVKSGDATMPDNANYETIEKVGKSYKSLMESKMHQLQKQIDQGMKGTAGINNEPQSPPKPATTGGFDWNAHPKVQ